MAQRKFSIGIDLGTSNSALAFSPLSGDGGSEVLAIPQWDTPSTVTESATVPSFLYLPEEAVAAQIRRHGPGSGDWVVGRLAQRKASETPGRVAKSAKSWLCHHAADRSAPFLPWGSDALAEQERFLPSPPRRSFSPISARHGTRGLQGKGPSFAFDAQDITVTVPASFDAAAQRLTLAAAEQAGFPDHVRLLEEPQAAFYWWLEQQAGRCDPWSAPARFAKRGAPCPGDRRRGRHVGFQPVRARPARAAAIPRSSGSPSATTSFSAATISISPLRISSNRASRRAGPDFPLGSGTTWSPGAGISRKRRCAGKGAPDEVFTVSIPGRGSRLIADSLSAQVTRAEMEGLILDGFFPDCRSTDRPRRALGAIKRIWASLCLRQRDHSASRRISSWSSRASTPCSSTAARCVPHAYAIGCASRSGDGRRGVCRRCLRARNSMSRLRAARPIPAGCRGEEPAGSRRAPRARCFLKRTGRRPKAAGKAARRSLVCILPHGAAPGQAFEVADLDLHLRINRLVRFQVYTSTRHEQTKAGDVVEPDPGRIPRLASARDGRDGRSRPREKNSPPRFLSG